MKLEILIKNYRFHINFTLESAKKNLGIDLYQGYKNFQNLLVRPFLAVFRCFFCFLAYFQHLYYGYLIFYQLATNFRLKCHRINEKILGLEFLENALGFLSFFSTFFGPFLTFLGIFPSKDMEFNFLVATKRLYKRVCPSVGPSVRQWVTLSSNRREMRIFSRDKATL